MRNWLALASLASLGACGPLVQIGGNTSPPTSLLTLTAVAPASVPVGQSPINMQTAVTVFPPLVPGALQTLRIPVMVTDTDIQYVTGAQWSEQPARLFRQLLSDTLGYGGIAIIDPRAGRSTGSRLLSGELTSFGVDVRSGQPVARVRFNATVTGPDGVRQRSFERTESMSAVTGQQAAGALNRAANAVAADVLTWVRS